MRIAGIALTALALGASTLAAEAPPEYRVEIAGGGSLAEGERGAASVTIRPLRGRRVSSDGPLQIDVAVAPATGLQLDRHRLRRGDAADPEAEAPRFEIGYRAGRAGSYRIAADIRFWICGDRTCRPVRERRTLPIEVSRPVDAGVDAAGQRTID